jgi:hypothetical protein
VPARDHRLVGPVLVRRLAPKQQMRQARQACSPRSRRTSGVLRGPLDGDYGLGFRTRPLWDGWS